MAKAGRYEVRWSRAASGDLEEIGRFLARESIEDALSTLDRLESSADALRSLPFRGRFVPELERFGVFNYRELVVAPYRMLYRVQGRRVLVLAVFDGRRDLETTILGRLLSQ